MDYRPRWERIILIAAVFNLAVMFALTSSLSLPKTETSRENLQMIEWTDSAADAVPAALQEEVQAFPEIKLTPLEIPKFEPIPPPESVEVEKVEKPVETQIETPVQDITSAENENPVESEKSVEPKPQEKNSQSKLIAIVKVYPRDLTEQFLASGVVKEKITLNDEKIIVAVTIGVDGKVKSAEIVSGAGDDERGRIINFVSQTAASSWIFEPYLDEDGNPVELQTQLEFTAADF